RTCPRSPLAPITTSSSPKGRKAASPRLTSRYSRAPTGYTRSRECWEEIQRANAAALMLKNCWKVQLRHSADSGFRTKLPQLPTAHYFRVSDQTAKDPQCELIAAYATIRRTCPRSAVLT